MNFLVRAAAEEDILRQVEWYADQGLLDVARRFSGAVQASLRAILAAPQMGKPGQISNPALMGLRSWPVEGFQLRVFYVSRPDVLQVIRVLHSKRDVDTILEDESVDDESMP